MARDKKVAKGCVVTILSAPAGARGVVIDHGKDSLGIYTKVRLDDGTVAAYHRSQLRIGHDPCALKADRDFARGFAKLIGGKRGVS